MTPTNKLRFVVRGDNYKAGKTEHGDIVELYDVQVLQQWWEDVSASDLVLGGEWRDVPIEEEL